MTLQYFLPGMCACTASDGTSARPRKHSLVYVSAAAERRDDGIEHTVVYKLLGLGACASHSFSISRPTASFRVEVCSFFFPGAHWQIKFDGAGRATHGISQESGGS